jgi:hypothetical protein
MSIKVEDMVFVDFEASSLDPKSWPVEVGMAWIEDDKVKSWSSLICPAPDWSMEHWSDVSAKIHRIPLSDLRNAPPASEVGKQFIERMQGKALISDAPEFETRWATRLAHAAMNGPEIPFSDFDAAVAHFFEGYALDCVYERLERLPAPHRAGIDAERMAKAFLRGLEVGASVTEAPEA